jgi:hypothetical protein
MFIVKLAVVSWQFKYDTQQPPNERFDLHAIWNSCMVEDCTGS